MNDFLVNIGVLLRAIRKEKNITINSLAGVAGVSNGLISKIENGRTIPSLPVFLRLVQSLKVDLSEFFESIENENAAKYIVVTTEKQKRLQKEIEAEGFSYMHIFSKSIECKGFEAVILTISPNSKREKVITDAWEFKHVLKGSCTYIIDDEEVQVNEGDSIYFNGRYPHVPVNKTNTDCTMLVLYFFS